MGPGDLGAGAPGWAPAHPVGTCSGLVPGQVRPGGRRHCQCWAAASARYWRACGPGGQVTTGRRLTAQCMRADGRLPAGPPRAARSAQVEPDGRADPGYRPGQPARSGPAGRGRGLYGLQQRVEAEVHEPYRRFLRRLAQELRQAQVPSLAESPVQDEPARRSLVNSLVAHLGRAFADPRTEIAKDRWT